MLCVSIVCGECLLSREPIALTAGVVGNVLLLLLLWWTTSLAIQ
jgi:hypothetical protein